MSHRMQSLVSPNGIARGGVLTCECGREIPYDRLPAALNRHARHARLAVTLEALLSLWKRAS